MGTECLYQVSRWDAGQNVDLGTNPSQGQVAAGYTWLVLLTVFIESKITRGKIKLTIFWS